MKRLIDIALGTMLVLVTAPIVLVTAVAVAIALQASPFFVQDRIGKDGRVFRFIKLRTLPRDTPKYAVKYQVQTMDMPPVCRRVRRLHFDELPQLWLVVTGKMSLVGPRPEMPFLHNEFDADFARRRTAVRPGCTGLWQIGIKSESLIYEHPEFDEHYLGNRSLRFDLWILSRTVRLLTPVGHRSLISLADLPPWARATSAPRAAEPQLQPAET